jgi:type VI secretion system protein
MMILKHGCTRHASSLRRALVMAALVCLLPGCGVFDGARSMLGMGPKPVEPHWNSLALLAQEDANNNSALAVDIVFIKNQSVLDALMVMPAAKWFSSRADLQRSFPETLGVLSYELVPSQTIKVGEALWRDQAAWAVLVFANYSSPGEHRARLMLNTPGYVVQLGAFSFSASDLKPGTAR